MPPEYEPGPEQRTVVQEANTAYRVFGNVGDKLKADGMSYAAVELEQIKSVGRFVDQNLPPLTREQKTSPDGYYSSAHMLANTTRYIEQVVAEDRQADMPKAVIAADQSQRLIAAGTYEKSKTIGNIRGRERTENFTLPNMIEIPGAWKKTPDGKKFSGNLGEFVKRRKQDTPVEQADLKLLSELSGLIGKSYEGATVDKSKLAQAPMAREMILINLELLLADAKQHLGKSMPGSPENTTTFELIRGLYNYNEGAELEQRLRPSAEFMGLPKIVDQPESLRT
jgi:hypothetical protein